MKIRTIWNSEVDITPELIKEYRDSQEDGGSELSEVEIMNRIYEDNNLSLQDEIVNLDIPLDHQILVIADLGLWDGRRSGYRVLPANVNAILRVSCGDFSHVYADAYNIRCSDTHHDGTNYYLFRELRGDTDECQPLIDAIYNGEQIITSLLNRYSRSLLPYVADVYGWPVAGKKRSA